MANTQTSFMGLNLKNPVIAGASNLSTNLDYLKRTEDAGVAAIVYKSLFEEQIQLEQVQLDDELGEYNERNAEMIKLFPDIKHAGPEEHLVNLRKAKESLGVPLIASLNAIYKETWLEYAKLIEETGVDGIEVNFFAVPKEMGKSGSSIEEEQINILKELKKSLKIPVSVKLSAFYTNPLNVISEMDKTGVDAFVLFNRLFQPDIDVDAEEHITPFNLSSPDDNKLPLRFAGLLYGNIKSKICSNSGIYSGKDLAKMILAGADCVQVVSVLYKNKFESIGKIVTEFEDWMTSKNYKSIDEFKGKLSNKNINDPFIYKRAQYVDILLKSDKILKKYPMV